MEEQTKYEAMWDVPSYRAFSPGAVQVPTFLEVANPQRGQTVRDLGCGTGRAGLMMHQMGLEVTQYDFAANCRDEIVVAAGLPFVQHDLMERIPGPPADLAFCTDVLEHIPTEHVGRVLRNVCIAGRRAFLQIACTPDHCGEAIGEPLHLTVEPYAWWRDQLEAFDCRILWSEDRGYACCFYVSAYADAVDIANRTTLNVTHDQVEANVRANLARDYAEAMPHAEQDVSLMILAGGPSLLDFRDEIIARRQAGEYLVTVNATHQLCREWGITPSIHIQCDAREFNRRFIEPPFSRTRYLLASQCHPSVGDAIPREQVTMWHSGEHLRELIAEYDREHGRERAWVPIFGGGTVILRAMPLLLLLGFRHYEFFGFDSSIRDGAHHAYPQPENDGRVTTEVSVGGRTFTCHPWMAAQAGDFLRLMKLLAPHVKLNVRGDGLIAHCIATAAEEI